MKAVQSKSIIVFFAGILTASAIIVISVALLFGTQGKRVDADSTSQLKFIDTNGKIDVYYDEVYDKVIYKSSSSGNMTVTDAK